MNIGSAIEAMKQGKAVRRSGWNGKGMNLTYVNTWTFTNGVMDNFPCAPFIVMKTADDLSVPWLASQTDLLADDWELT